MPKDSAYEFDKTKVQVKLYTIDGVYISRSQARRILTGLEKFKIILFDFDQVPIVGQAFADEIFGMIFGPKMGAKIILAYLVEGICGLPVFANFSFGMPVLLGPTGGYLIGFIPAAILAGYLLQHGWAKHRFTIFLAALFGTVVLFIPGYFYLAHYYGVSQRLFIWGITFLSC